MSGLGGPVLGLDAGIVGDLLVGLHDVDLVVLHCGCFVEESLRARGVFEVTTTVSLLESESSSRPAKSKTILQQTIKALNPTIFSQPCHETGSEVCSSQEAVVSD